MAVPDRDFLLRSEALWKSRHTKYQAELEEARERESHWYHHWRALTEHRPDDDPHRVAAWHDYDQARQIREAAEAKRDEASEMLALRRRQLAQHDQQTKTKPKIVTAKQQGISFTNRFGQLGPEHHVTVHHTAGPTDGSDSQAVRLNQSYHRAHANKGWGGIGYAYNIARSGTIFCLRPTILKGAHVGGYNTSNVGVMFHGTTGDRPTQAQVDSFEWLLSNANTRAMPSAHRTDRPLSRPHTNRRGHNDWSGHTTNACPGTHKPILELRRS